MLDGFRWNIIMDQWCRAFKSETFKGVTQRSAQVYINSFCARSTDLHATQRSELVNVNFYNMCVTQRSALVKRASKQSRFKLFVLTLG